MKRSISAKNTILDVVGKTPVLRMGKFSAAIGCEVFVKLENLNPGGSHKVRIAIAMIVDAEQKGVLCRNSGQTIIEPSGGNTGIGLAMAGALLGYKVVLVIPDNYSKEKQVILKLYGAEVILSDSRLGNNSHGMKTMELQLEHPDYVMLNQQRNQANPEIHRQTTANEVFDVFGEHPIDFFVGGVGTGGHITGIGERLKERWPSVQIIGVQPEGCDLLNNRHSSHDIQGLSVGLIPDVLNVSVIDKMAWVSRQECVDMVHRIMSTEAVSLGISSAANFVAIEKLSKSHIPKDATVFTMVYDGVESYLSYFAKSAERPKEPSHGSFSV